MTETNQAVAVRQPREIQTVHDPVAVFDTAQFEHMQRVAVLMARASLIPEVLKGASYEETLGNCFLIVNQANKWKADPFAVAQCTAMVHGKPCYEGKLIAAVVEANMGVRLKYEWFGEPGKDSHGIKVTHPDKAEEYVQGTVGEWKTKEKGGTDKANWVGANTQRKQLKYRGDREWARMWAPGLMLGVYTPDELEELEDDARARNAAPVQPRRTTQERLKSGLGGPPLHHAGPSEGFSSREEPTPPKVAEKPATPASEAQAQTTAPSETKAEVIDAEVEELDNVPTMAERLAEQERQERIELSKPLEEETVPTEGTVETTPAEEQAYVYGQMYETPEEFYAYAGMTLKEVASLELLAAMWAEWNQFELPRLKKQNQKDFMDITQLKNRRKQELERA